MEVVNQMEEEDTSLFLRNESRKRHNIYLAIYKKCNQYLTTSAGEWQQLGQQMIFSLEISTKSLKILPLNYHFFFSKTGLF